MTNIFKEIEAQEYSVQDIRFGMAALLQCNTSDIDELDNRKYDEYFQAVTRVLYAVKLSVQKDKLFGSEIYQAAANHYEPIISDLRAIIAKYGSGEAVAYSYAQRHAGGNISHHLTFNAPNKKLVEYGNIFEVEPLYTHQPITEQANSVEDVAELTDQRDRLLAQLNEMVETYQYEASSENPTLLATKALIAEIERSKS